MKVGDRESWAFVRMMKKIEAEGQRGSKRVMFRNKVEWRYALVTRAYRANLAPSSHATR